MNSISEVLFSGFLNHLQVFVFLIVACNLLISKIRKQKSNHQNMLGLECVENWKRGI